MEYETSYDTDEKAAKDFLLNFNYIDADCQRISKYPPLLKELANHKQKLLYIDLADLRKFDPVLEDKIVSNTHRYKQIFQNVIDALLPSYQTLDAGNITQRCGLGQANLQRTELIAKANSSTGVNTEKMRNWVNRYPPALFRWYEICFIPASSTWSPVGAISAELQGKLVTTKGLVTNVLPIEGKMEVVCFLCDKCQCDTVLEVSPFDSSFMPLTTCMNPICQSKGTASLHVSMRGSKVVKLQRIMIQDHPDDLQFNTMPRCLEVYLPGELAGTCTANSLLLIAGYFVTPTYENSIFYAQHLKILDSTGRDVASGPMSLDEVSRFRWNEYGTILDYLSSCIAPEIHGYRDLKKALLVQLVGGVEKMIDGTSLRGSIHICLMGDPGTAKSQFLLSMMRIAPKSQYATGRGSSAVGLTASIARDPVTGDTILESGCLALADGGITCIDEFDKLHEADRVAIHETMEQQTISIAKAGIVVTMSAKTSILAAANPAYGRYNDRYSLAHNINLPKSLLSRFDLIWLIKDQADVDSDLRLASHVTKVHMDNYDARPNTYMNYKDLRRYIMLCKTKEPRIPEELDDMFVDIYLSMRANGRKTMNPYYVSARSLLTLIRISTALARLRLSDLVEEGDILEAKRLYDRSFQEAVISEEDALNVGDPLMEIVQRLCGMGKSCSLDAFFEEAKDTNINEKTLSILLTLLEEDKFLRIEGREIFMLDKTR